MTSTSLKIYPLPSGQFVVSYFDATKKKRIQQKFSEEIKAREFYQGIKVHKPAASPRERRTAGELIRQYLQENPDCYLSQSTKLVREFLAAFDLYAPKDISEVALRSFLIQLKNEHDYSDRTMLRCKSMLSGFFRFLIEKDMIDKSPLNSIKFDRGAPFKRKPVILESDEIQSFIRLAKRYSTALFYPIFLLIAETAAKTSDITSLQWKDVNLKARRLSLVRSKELQDRHFTISEELMRALQRMDHIGEFVFTSLEGRPMKNYILARELKRFQRQMKLSTAWGLRDLRASFAAHFLRVGGSITDLQKIMGHRAKQQTEEIYGRYRAVNTESFEDS